MRPYELTCEGQVNPLGIDELSPRFAWKIPLLRRGIQQTAYQIVAESEGKILWDSGKVDSPQSIEVEYCGLPLKTRQKVYWRVRFWDESGKVSDYSETAWFQMGLLNPSDWLGKWIETGIIGGARVTAPAPYLRKPFQVKKPVASAELYITALGLYLASINGRSIGDEVFAPGWTDYHCRVQYQVYDVTSHLQFGENVLGVVLGDGWYCGHIANMDRQQYGDRPRLLAQLMIQYMDGSFEIVPTDETWRYTSGPILESDLIMGESYDARLEMSGWDTPGWNDTGWFPVHTVQLSSLNLVARKNPPVRRQEVLRPVQEPVELREWNRSRWIFDLGQNMVGVIRLRVKGERGRTIRIRYSEVLNPDGSLYTQSLRSARATDYYTLKGGEEEIFEPHFTFHGFRYVELTGFPGVPTRENIEGVVLHSDTPISGTFICSDPFLNQLQHNIEWSQKGNFIEVPTDCPQRDERLGWTGDAQVFIRTATFNRNVSRFFEKWMQDFADAQSSSGAIPPVVPKVFAFGQLEDGGPAWADAVLICPWTIYQVYGNRRILERYYPVFQKFIEYLKNTSVGWIRSHPDWVDQGNFPGFGDWLAQDGSGKVDGGTPKDLIATAFFAHSARLMAKIARCLGKSKDEQVYHTMFEKIREAFNRRFVTEDGLIVGRTQTAYVLALSFDLLSETLQERALEELLRDIRQRDWHLSTGFVGTPYLLWTLTKFGKAKEAWKLLTQRTMPSWLYPVLHGATTIWERWDGWTEEKGFQDPEMNSFNHYAYGSVGAWMVSMIGGLDFDPEYPGYRHILMKPLPDIELDFASVEYQTPYGKVVSRWQKDDRHCWKWQVTIPPSTCATVWLPEAVGKEVLESGVPLPAVEMIEWLGEEGDAVKIRIPAGNYEFCW